MVGRFWLLFVLALGLNSLCAVPSKAQAPDISGVYRSGRAETPCGRGSNFGPKPGCPVNDLGMAAFARATPATAPTPRRTKTQTTANPVPGGSITTSPTSSAT